MTGTDYYRKAELWGGAPEPYQLQVRADLQEILPADARSVLDLGCGDGLLTNCLVGERTVVGLDVSETALRHVQAPAVVGSAAQLPFADGSFDLVMANDLLEHLDDATLARVEAEMRRVARRYVLVTVPLLEDLAASRARCRHCGTEYHVNHHVRSWDEPTLVRLFEPDLAAVELRFSGSLLGPPPDPCVPLLRSQGVWHYWQKSHCPQCGSEPGAADAAVAEAGTLPLDHLRAEGFWGRDPARATHVDRSEAMVLFSRAPSAARPGSEAAPTRRSLLAVDFGNPLQEVADWRIGTTLAGWRRGARVVVADGALTVTQGSGAAWFEVCMPIITAVGDRLELELSAGSPDAVAVHQWDPLVGEELQLEPGSPDGPWIAFAIQQPRGASRFGTQWNIHLDDGVALKSVRYRSVDGAGDADFFTVRPGHNVFSLPGTTYRRSFGVYSEHGGWLPAPRWTEAVATACSPIGLADVLALHDRIDSVARQRATALTRIADEHTGLQQQIEIAARKAQLQTEQAEQLRQEVDRLDAWLTSTRPVQRVLVLANWFPSQAQPGLGSFVLDQVKALRAATRLDVRVISGRPFWIGRLWPQRIAAGIREYRRAMKRLTWAEWDGVPVLDVPYLAGIPFTFVTHASTYSHAIVQAARQARQSFPFDLVHAHTAYVDGTAGVAVARRFDVPLVVTEHTNPFSVLTRNPVIRARTLRALRRADRSWAVSEALAQDIRRWLRPGESDVIRILRNGVDTQLFEPPAQWHPDRTRPRIFAVGIMHDYKNPLLLVEAFALVRRDVPGAELHLVGDGPLSEAVRARAATLGVQEGLHCHGQKDRAGVACLLREDADLLAVSSRSETFGVVVIEALACGKPVVATRCGGPEEILTDPRLGALAANDDPAALAAALTATIAGLDPADSPFRRQFVEQRYSFDELARDLSEQYQDVFRARRSRR